MIKKIFIKKRNGEEEEFKVSKIERSLKNSGADKKLSKKISNIMMEKICEDCSSDSIYNTIDKILKKEKNQDVSLRYNLTLSILKLGPEGFAFEKFIGEIFEAYNYSPVFVGKKITGKCINSHEMDIVATNGNILTTAELKFHNSRSKKTDLKVALYMKARFDDIVESGYYGTKKARKMIITNTKFTTNAKKYSECVGIEVLSWNFPEDNNLHNFILNSGVHPLTALETISNKAKEFFVKKRIVSCNDLLKNNNRALKENYFIPKQKIPLVIEEIMKIKKSNFIKK